MINIRLAKKEDLQELASLYCKVFTVFDVGERWTEKTAYNLLLYWFNKQPDLFFLAEEKKKIIGAFVAGVKPWCDGNHLFDGEIIIDPDHQKKGIGSKISKVVYRTAIEKYNAKCFEANTFKHHKHPLSWYKKQGFKEVEDLTIIEGNLRDILHNLEDNNH